jgi:hypothetical protein
LPTEIRCHGAGLLSATPTIFRLTTSRWDKTSARIFFPLGDTLCLIFGNDNGRDLRKELSFLKSVTTIICSDLLGGSNVGEAHFLYNNFSDG